MKHYLKYLIILLLAFTTLAACQKEELEHPITANPITLAFQGFILDDTLEFVLKDKVICTAFENNFIMLNGNLFTPGGEVIIRRKQNSKQLGQFKIDAAPYNLIKNIFYDGHSIKDKIELDPVSNPDHMGLRLRFKTTFADFYGGPVDIQLFDEAMDNSTFEYTVTPAQLIQNVTASFGEFTEIDIPAITDGKTHFLVFKVYKAGTTQLPYTSTDKVNISDPDNNYGSLDFIKGSSQLVTISPNQDSGHIGDGYSVITLISK